MVESENQKPLGMYITIIGTILLIISGFIMYQAFHMVTGASILSIISLLIIIAGILFELHLIHYMIDNHIQGPIVPGTKFHDFNCPNCGTIISKKVSTCPGCGGVFCYRCKIVVEPGTMLCPDCKQPL